MRRGRLLAGLAAVLLAACGRPPAKPVEDLRGLQDLSNFTLQSMHGTRDGDRLAVRAAFGDGARELAADLRFIVAPPTRLETGTWSGLGDAGAVSQRSVTFLGGQSGPPSVGGRFDLLGADGSPRYRITIPVQPLEGAR